MGQQRKKRLQRKLTKLVDKKFIDEPKKPIKDYTAAQAARRIARTIASQHGEEID